MSTPTPAPALTGEAVTRITHRLRGLTGHYPLDSLSADLFDTWLAAVVAQAKREERERTARGIADLIDAARVKQETEEALNPDRDGDLGYRNGELDGLSNALLITESTR